MKTRKYRKLKSRKRNKMSKHRRKRYSNRKTKRKSYNGGGALNRLISKFKKKSLEKKKKYLDEIQKNIALYRRKQFSLLKFDTETKNYIIPNDKKYLYDEYNEELESLRNIYSILYPLYIDIMTPTDATTDVVTDADADADADAHADADADDAEAPRDLEPAAQQDSWVS